MRDLALREPIFRFHWVCIWYVLLDRIDVSPAAGKLFWTNMGRVPSANDGLVMSANLDCSDIGVIIPEGKAHTPKQLVVDHDNEKLYFCDREGMRIYRCGFGGGRR